MNFRRDEDAIEALNSLQGSSVAGASLRIEFAKAVSVLYPHNLCVVVFSAYLCTLPWILIDILKVFCQLLKST